jgi:hypothetical protein
MHARMCVFCFFAYKQIGVLLLGIVTVRGLSLVCLELCMSLCLMCWCIALHTYSRLWTQTNYLYVCAHAYIHCRKYAHTQPPARVSALRAESPSCRFPVAILSLSLSTPALRTLFPQTRGFSISPAFVLTNLKNLIRVFCQQLCEKVGALHSHVHSMFILPFEKRNHVLYHYET